MPHPTPLDPLLLSADTPCVGPTNSEVGAVVLDTNVVLDWLVFNDARCSALAAQLNAGQLRWIATDAMRTELRSVLPRPELLPWKPDGEHVLSTFDRLACLLPAVPTLHLRAGLLCRDEDDQKFIDLAIAFGARWLFSRDRALLDLAKRARKHGVEIVTPADWLRRQPPPILQDNRGGPAAAHDR